MRIPKIINNFKEPIKKKTKPPETFWDKFQNVLNLILN